jgi:hypothetical protein
MIPAEMKKSMELNAEIRRSSIEFMSGMMKKGKITQEEFDRHIRAISRETEWEREYRAAVGDPARMTALELKWKADAEERSRRIAKYVAADAARARDAERRNHEATAREHAKEFAENIAASARKKSIDRWTNVAQFVGLILLALVGGWLFNAVFGPVSFSPTVLLLCIVAFFLWLRARPSPKPDTPLVAEEPAPEKDPDENTFIIDEHKYGGSSIELDVDTGHKYCEGHFVRQSRFEECSGGSEFEYRVEGTEVFQRLLHDYEDAPIDGRTWDVRDGVVLEVDTRERNEKQCSKTGPLEEALLSLTHIDGKIDSLKKATEWNKMGCSSVKYFILSRKLPLPDARRFLRQELERLKMAIKSFTKEAVKVGLELDDEQGIRLAKNRSEKYSKEEFDKLLSSAGISENEFFSRNRLVAVLRELLGETPIKDETGKPTEN